MPPISSSRLAPVTCWTSPAASIFAIQLLRSCLLTVTSRECRSLSVAAADRIREPDEAVAAQRFGELALDAADELRAFEHQRRVDLHERGAGADFLISV